MRSMRSLIKNLGAWRLRLLGAYIWYDWILFGCTVLGAVIKDLFESPPKPDINGLKKRSGQVAVITGGPRGLALGMIKRLVELDYTIIMGVRNIEYSQNRLARFAMANKQLSFDKVTFLELDLASLKSVRKFADALLRQTTRIDLLLCNAAILLAPYEMTVDGYESQFQVNYLAHFLLTHLLLDRLKETAELKGWPCQVIYSSSCLHKYAKFDREQLEKPDKSVYTPAKFYFPTKLYQVMTTVYLQRQLELEGARVYLYAVHPGAIVTEILDQAGFFVRTALRTMAKIMRNVENGADTILWPVLSREYLHRGGFYMESGRSMRLCAEAGNRENQRFLYNKSLRLVGFRCAK